MRKTAAGTTIKRLSLLAVSLFTLLAGQNTLAQPQGAVAEGMEIAFDRKRGNCLACHQIEGGAIPGNTGPPLVAMKSRFPDKAKLRAQIWDATAANPNSMMPPFGKHRVLTEAELDKVLEFIYSL